MTVPALVAVDFGGPAGSPRTPGAPLLVLGPSLGTSVTSLWGGCARILTRQVRVRGWELPGHGHGTTVAAEAFSVSDLASAVLALVDDIAPGETFHYAGDSVGGAVGLALSLDAPHRVSTATLLCTAARFGTADAWLARAAAVRADGTQSLLDASAQRWFTAEFAARQPDVVARMLDGLAHTDDEGYARICEALAEFDVRGRLGEIATPVLAVAGGDDTATPSGDLAEIAARVQHGRLVVLDGVAHLAPAEVPERVAELVLGQLAAGRGTAAGVYETGLAVRRAVLGDEHVDRAIADTTAFTADFQQLITEYAWGTIWARPGLERRDRSLITLTALVAGGHYEELAMHVRAARRIGLTDDELRELFLQTAIYCGVPAANSAFRIASRVLAEAGTDGGAEAEAGDDGQGGS